MKQKIAVIVFSWVYFTFTTTTSFLYFTKPRIRTVTIEIPGPAPAAPDSVTEIPTEGWARLILSQLASERTIAELHRQLAAADIRPAEILVQATDADTAVGLKLYRSMKTFIHPTMYFGSVESYIEATAPASVKEFTNRIRFMEGESTIMDRLRKQWRFENPCPPGHFWTGFGYGGMTGLAAALAAVLLIGK